MVEIDVRYDGHKVVRVPIHSLRDLRLMQQFSQDTWVCGPIRAGLVDFRVEPDTPPAVIDDLRRRGHDIHIVDGPQGGWGPMSVIGLDGDRRVAAADPRVDTTEALVF